VETEADAPLRSGLGGSGALAVALIGAISCAVSSAAQEQMGLNDIVLLAHHIEDSLVPHTGLQDQLSSAYGKANLWQWKYGSRLEFTRDPLTDDCGELERCIVLADTGRPHPEKDESGSFVRKIAEEGCVEQVGAISDLARQLARAIRAGDVDSAATALRAEADLRSQLLGTDFSEQDLLLIRAAKDNSCGVRFTGRGGGGCLWALGRPSSIDAVRGRWQQILEERGSGRLLTNTIAREGLKIERSTLS
jgi:D-glycero-alpha-D-manno-heptose-7-phosphate kinase